MYKEELAQGIYRCYFDPLEGRHFSGSIYAVVSGDKALLIDTGWEHEGAQAAQDLERSGLKLAGVIISHFHDDHMQGLKALPRAPVYGSAQYQHTLDLWTDKQEHPLYTPSVVVQDTLDMDFGEHSIRMIPFPGHSACTMLTLIDNAYLCIADEIMFSDSFEPILPGAEPGCIQRHIDSLKRLKSYSAYTFLPAHGRPFYGAEETERQIDKRIRYFSAIINAGKEISYEEAASGCGGFLHSEWHEYNR